VTPDFDDPNEKPADPVSGFVPKENEETVLSGFAPKEGPSGLGTIDVVGGSTSVLVPNENEAVLLDEEPKEKPDGDWFEAGVEPNENPDDCVGVAAPNENPGDCFSAGCTPPNENPVDWFELVEPNEKPF